MESLLLLKKNRFEKIGEEIRFKDTENELHLAAMALHLRDKTTPNVEFLLIATHLKSEKTEEGEKIRQKQMGWLLNHLSHVNIPIILACDMNANPIKNKNGYEPLCYREVTQLFGFESVYVKGQGREPEFTTFKKRKDIVDKHTIDYIFVKNGRWKVSALLQIETVLDMNSSSSVIPNWNYPSDHFAIGCKLHWSGNNTMDGKQCPCTIK